MRIVALVTDAYGGRGGIAQYNRDLLDALGASGQVSRLRVLPRGAGEAIALPPRVDQLPARLGRVSYSFASAREALGEPVDLVFCGHLYMAPLAVGLALARGVPVWLQLHGIEAWHHSTLARRWGVEHSSLVTCVSRYTRRRLLGWSDIEPRRVRVLPDTVDPRFSPGPRDAALCDRLGLAGGRVLLTVGRLSAAERYKGHDRVLRCLPMLLSRHPDLVFAIAGDGDDRPRLEELARQLGVAPRVRFLGYVPDADLPALYRLADVFVMPSTGEGFGIVYLEALASRTPVVAGNRDASSDPLQDGRLGKLVEPDAPGELAEAIEESLDASVAEGAGAVFNRHNFHAAVARLVEEIRRGRFSARSFG